MALSDDPSNGYDAAAEAYIAARSDAGVSFVRSWAETLPKGASIIDVGAGHGEPLMPVLLGASLKIHAIDASEAMVAAFRARFPDVPVACEAAEGSGFFNRTFDAALAIGLIFLLAEDKQALVLKRVSSILHRGGRFLFSAPWQTGTWDDLITGRRSHGLGKAAYRRLIEESGLKSVKTHTDDTGTFYYEAEKADG